MIYSAVKHTVSALLLTVAVISGVPNRTSLVADERDRIGTTEPRRHDDEDREVGVDSDIPAKLSPLDSFRLCILREKALTRQDLRAIEKLVKIERHIRSTVLWTPMHTSELRQLLQQIEARFGLTVPDSVPADVPAEATAFAVPRREWHDVRFAKSPGADAREQSLDVYAPATGERRPIVVWFHGGGMKGGDKAHPGIIVLKPDFFVSRGFVFVSANYRLAPHHVHPAQAEDTAAALAWVHDHAAEYGGDAGKVTVIGMSAGAHLAAVVATNERFLATRGKSPAIIAGAVILDIGSFDIPGLKEQAGERAPEMYPYAFPGGGKLEDWKDCSPIYHVRPEKKVPPLLLYYVEGRDHHARENERFAKLVKESGGQAVVLSASGKTHLSIEAEIGTRTDSVTTAILRFIETHAQERQGATTGRSRTTGKAIEVAQALTNPSKASEPKSADAASGPKWVTRSVEAPRVEFRTFESKAAATSVSFHVFTPEIYDTEQERRFPVLYWLHGTGGGLAGIAPLSAYFDRAIRDGKIPPMLIVFPNGLASSMWSDSKDGAVPMETVVVKELVPHIDATFRTIASREGRMIEGFSMGGYGAARLGFKDADLFGAVSILAGGPLDLEFQGPRALENPAERDRILAQVFGGDMGFFREQSPWMLAERYAAEARVRPIRIRVVVGGRDVTAELNQKLSERLTALKITHTFTEVPDIGHSTMPLLNALGERNWEFYRTAFGDRRSNGTP